MGHYDSSYEYDADEPYCKKYMDEIQRLQAELANYIAERETVIRVLDITEKENKQLTDELAEANAKIMRLEGDGVLSDCESQYQMLAVKNKQLTERVGVLEGALKNILGNIGNIHDKVIVSMANIETIARKALEDSV